MTTLKLFRRLRALEPGQSGRVTAAELMKIEVPEPYYLLKDRAEWLRNQLPFSCDLKEGKTNDGWVFSRGPRHTSKASLQICEVGSVQG